MEDKVAQLEEKCIKDFLKKNKYQYQQVLGKGDFSQVVKAYSEKSQCQVAIKVLKKIKGGNQIDLQEFEKEIIILQKLKNEKYVLQILEKIQDDQEGLAAIVTELCDCNLTTIFDLNQFDQEQVLAMAYQLLNGLFVLSEKGIIHSDIKPDNILFSKSKNQFLIADYGLSHIIKDPSSQKTMASLGGNYGYASPEVMGKQKPYSITADVFSIGQIIIEVFLQRRLGTMEWISLKTQSLFAVIPSLQNSQEIEFVNKVIAKMVEVNKDLRLQPVALLQNLKSFDINENSLKKLRISKELRKIIINNINEIFKAIDYDIVEIYLSWNSLGAEGAKNIGMSLEKCQNISSLNLNLGGNNLGAEGAKNIGMSLEKCQNISSLNLDLIFNRLGAKGAKNIGMSLEKCQNISSLNLNLTGNNLDQKLIENLEESMKKKNNYSELKIFI